MNYSTLFPSATRSLPRFSALAEAVLSQAADLISVTAALPAAFSVSGAAGAQLDALGASFLQPRPSNLSDEDYRVLLRARLAFFPWDGSNDSAREILSAVFPGSSLSDNCDGTVSVRPVSLLQAEHLLFPVPAGIRPVEDSI